MFWHVGISCKLPRIYLQIVRISIGLLPGCQRCILNFTECGAHIQIIFNIEASS
jgi:hypothetical protein